MKIRKGNAAFITAVAAGTILNPLNSSMIALALHSIQKDYQLSFATVSWLISGFYLISAIGQPITGKMGDLIGRKKLFLTGLIIAAAASLSAPIAPTFSLLLLMRLLQAAGSSSVYPSGVALVHDHVPHAKQATSLAVLAICASVMTAFGPTVGGFLIVWGGWQSIFYVNIPFILFSFTLGWIMIPKDVKKKPLHFKTLLAKLDLLGIALFSTGMISLLWFLLTLEESVNYIILSVAVLSFILLCVYEWHANQPFIDVRLLKSNHKLSIVYLLFILLNIANYCLFYGMPSYFQSGMHLSVRLSGAMMLFMSMASVIVSLLSGRWIERQGTSMPIKIGALLTALGSIGLLWVSMQTSWLIGAVLMILGAGYGIGNVALQSTMLDASPKDAVGTSSGLFQTCRYIGSIGSTAVLGLIFGKTVTQHHLLELSWVLVFVSILALLISLFFFKNMRLHKKITE
ncbi:MFS transporter [Sporolactobacillus kofuensis]|uniref:MFS transporter n=1 Tax=Sporolactobacillus kofuensis TaxID=269672 RepID=A0ABW1WBZ9_9BACL|nr:MFS transporter [Sporolactobacillus kofuensis]MCO7175128.1 MFS transporter [Sporolactobacillus kofuensis]